MCGGIIAALGLFVSSWIPSLYALFITYGVLIGLGASLCYLSALVAVGQFFKKRKSLATGIVVSGSGVGTVAFPPLVNALLASYGWRGTFRFVRVLILMIGGH